jgi:3-hydroxybutyryl-CoA dehydrogenase
MSIERVAVLGAGTMGHGIAQVAALAGWDTRLYDIDEEALGAGLEKAAANLEAGVERGKVTPEARDAARARLKGTPDLATAVAEVDAVIEAVPEKLDLKRSILETVAESVSPATLLASNTSSLSITEIADGVEGPERVIGMHFFNPVHIMKLVELVVGGWTSRHTVQRARLMAEEMGKTPIIVKDSPGFASSRLGVALGLEAMRMLQEGVASAEDIDTAMELGYRHPMGPLKLTDLVGLDVRLEIARYLHRELGGEHFRPPAILEQKVEEGKLGKKSGEGFYQWDGE